MLIGDADLWSGPDLSKENRDFGKPPPGAATFSVICEAEPGFGLPERRQAADTPRDAWHQYTDRRTSLRVNRIENSAYVSEGLVYYCNIRRALAISPRLCLKGNLILIYGADFVRSRRRAIVICIRVCQGRTD